MILKSISLQNFRSYTKQEFMFSPSLTVIVGPNAAGKTNLIEAIGLLATGKSFRTDKEKQLVQFGKPVARIKGIIEEPEAVGDGTKETKGPEETDVFPSLSHLSPLSPLESTLSPHTTDLEVVVSESAKFVLQKRYLVNGVSKRRADFAGRLPVVIFTPLDLDIVFGQPSHRRRFLDDVLEQVDLDYRVALTLYTKALRQRNALLDQVQELGVRDEERFAYWDSLLIKNGGIVTKKREELIVYINTKKKNMFPFVLEYDKSIMSRERLLQYKDAEVGAGMTLVGPQRDDVIIRSHNETSGELEDVKYFCSRGQQRLVTLELKLSQISFIKEQTDEDPLLVLDDIFSELDNEHIAEVLQMSSGYQTIITTTHKEFIHAIEGQDVEMVELGG